MQSGNQNKNLFHGVDLQALFAFQSERGQVFSLYLDLRSGGDPASRFAALLAEVEEQHHLAQDTPENQRQWKEEAERIRGWLEGLRPGDAQGLALIGSLSDGLWHPFLLPVPVHDRLSVKEQAYVLPLELIQAEYPCALVAIFEAGETRLLRAFLGRVDEISSATEKDAKKDAKKLAKSMRKQIEAAGHGCDHLIVIGSADQTAALREALPDMPITEAQIAPRAAVSQLLARVREIDLARERETETRLVTELLASGENDSDSVVGMEQTLLAARGGKVSVLVVEEDFRVPGGECPGCGFLDEGDQGVCLLCGMSLRPEPDIVAIAMKRVVEKGGAVDVLRSPENRRALQDHGRIGAILRQADPREEETANRRGISGRGKAHRDALHDEHIEESFPASDPPGNW